MDHNVAAVESWICQQEADNDEACLRTAMQHGHSAAAAELCDDGSVGCPDCPFMLPLTNKTKK